MGKANTKKIRKNSKKTKKLEERKPLQIKKSTLRTIIITAAVIVLLVTGLIIRAVVKKRIAERTVNIAFYGLSDTMRELLIKQIPQEENIILNFDVISDNDFDTALIKDKYDMLFTWRGEATDSLSGVAEELPARVLEIMPSTISREAKKNKCVPILLDHCELAYSEDVVKKLNTDLPTSLNSFIEYLNSAKGVVFSPFFCNGAEDRILIDFVGALVLAKGGLASYEKLIEELRKAESLEEVIDTQLGADDTSLRSILDMLKAWPKEGLTHPAWFNGRGNDLLYFAEDKQIACFFTTLSEHRKIPYNVISQYESWLVPSNHDASDYGLIAPAVSAMLLSANSNCKRYLANFFTEEMQSELSNLTALAPVHSRAQPYDRQADDVRFFAASCKGGAMPDLYLAVYQRKTAALEKMAAEIRAYVR